MFLTLSPKHRGKLTIGPVKLIKDNKVVAASNPITITVVPSNQGYRHRPITPPSIVTPPTPSMPSIPTPTLPNMGGRQLNNSTAIFINVMAPNRPVYVGEPFYVEYDLFVRSDVTPSVTDVKSLQDPNFQGVMVQPLDVPQNTYHKTINGVDYDAAVQWRGILTPLSNHPIVLPRMKIRVVTVGSMFNGGYVISSNPKTVIVRELPQKGKPGGFYGLVGEFLCKASLDRQTINANESAVLTVKVSGSGSIKSIKQPKIYLPAGLSVEPLPGGVKDVINAGRGGYFGSRTFQYLITPSRPGKYTIPSISIPFFNPLKGQYDFAKSRPITLLVLKHSGSQQVVKNNNSNRHDMLIPLSNLIVEDNPSKPFVPSKTLFILLTVLPVFFWIGSEAYHYTQAKKLKDPATWRRNRAQGLALENLKKISNLTAPDVVSKIDDILRTFLEDRFSISARSMTIDQIYQMVTEINPDAARQLKELFEALDFMRFAPAAARHQDIKELISRAESIIKQLSDKKGR